MSTVSRRKKAALAAGKPKTISTVQLPAFDDGAEPSPNGNGDGKTPKIRAAKPILSNLEAASRYGFTDHAAEQMSARGISPAEALSAIIDPESTTPTHYEDKPHVLKHLRGDIAVVVDPKTFSVVTVIDLDEDDRMSARTPQWANLVEQMKIPAVLPVQRATTRRPKDLPESEEVTWLFGRHTKEDIRYVDVSPVIAQALLDRNTRNRPKRKRDVEEWSTEMAGGRWRITHQGVALARDGVILDGQHRLESVVTSGVTVRMPVAVGLDPEVFSVIDTGRRRSSGDAMSMVGETNAAQYAAIVRMALQYDTGVLAKRKGGRVNKLHADVLLAYRDGKEELLAEACRVAQNFRAMGLKANKTAVGTAHFLISRACGDEELVASFFQGTRTGADLGTDDPRYVLRRVILNDMAVTSSKHLAFFLKAWRMYAQDVAMKPRSSFSYRIDEEMPIVFVPMPKDMR